MKLDYLSVFYQISELCCQADNRFYPDSNSPQTLPTRDELPASANVIRNTALAFDSQRLSQLNHFLISKSLFKLWNTISLKVVSFPLFNTYFIGAFYY